MRKSVIGLVLGPRHKSTASSHFAVGLSVPRVTSDGRVLAAFVAGVVLTAAAFFAASPFVVHH